MRALKLIAQILIELLKQAWLVPLSTAAALRKRRESITRDEVEAERLDRIRNPSKYLGR
jgi:hypothetical protein